MANFSQWLKSLSDKALKNILIYRNIEAENFTELAARLSSLPACIPVIRARNILERALIESAIELHADINPIDPPKLVEYATERIKNIKLLAPTKTQWNTAWENLHNYALFYTDTENNDKYYLVNDIKRAVRLLKPVLPEKNAQLSIAEAKRTIASISEKEKKILYALQKAQGTGITSHAHTPGHPVHSLITAHLLLIEEDKPESQKVTLPWAVHIALEKNIYIKEENYTPKENIPQISSAHNSINNAYTLCFNITQLLKRKITLNKDHSLGQRERKRLQEELGPDSELCIDLAKKLALLTPYQGILEKTIAGEEWLHKTLAQQWASLLWTFWNDSLDTQAILGALYTGESLFFYCPDIALEIEKDKYEHIVAIAEKIGLIDSTGNPTQLCYPLMCKNHALLIEELEKILPPTGTQLIAQNDMTLLAPNPLPYKSYALLSSFADIESPGLASLWRISATRIDQALDEGISVQTMLNFLHTHCIGGVPDVIKYIISDRGRAHRALTLGKAMSYLVAEEELIEDVLHRMPENVQRIAPTVLISTKAPAILAQDLQSHHFRVALDQENIIITGKTRIPTPAQEPQLWYPFTTPHDTNMEEIEKTISDIRLSEKDIEL